MSGNIKTNTKAKYIGLEAVITRADGTVEHLGTIAEQHYTLSGKIKNFIGKVFK